MAEPKPKTEVIVIPTSVYEESEAKAPRQGIDRVVAFLLGSPVDDIVTENRRRTMLLNGILLSSILLMAPYGLNALFRGYASVAMVQGSVAVLLALTAVLFRITGRYDLPSVLCIAIMGLLQLFLFMTGGVNTTGHLWSFSFPLMAVFLLGSRAGTAATYIFLGAILVFFAADFPVSAEEYIPDFRLRYVGSFLAVYFLACFFEYVSLRFEKRLREESTRLEDAGHEIDTAKQFLSDSEATVQTLIDRAQEGILVIQDKVIKLANKRASELGGYTVDEIMGNSFTEHIHPDYVKDVFANYMLRIKGVRVPDRYRSALLHRDGSQVDVEIGGGRIVMNGEPADLVFLRPLDGAEEPTSTDD